MPGDPRDDALYGRVFDAAPAAMVVVDPQGLVVLANPRCVSVLGHDQDALVGRRLESVIPGCLTAREPGRPEEFAALIPGGVTREVEVTVSEELPGGDRLVCVEIRDVSENKRLLADSERIREDLVATVSHELRTPLTSIIGYVELLEDMASDHLSDKARRLVSIISRNADRELRLVNDLLTLAFVDNATIDQPRERVDLSALACSVVESARTWSGPVQLDLDVAPVPVVMGDPPRLTQVVENLVSNAVKFTPGAGLVTVRVYQKGPSVVLEVQDTGIGVEKHEQTLVFVRLFRSAEAVRRQIQGAGLGLPIVKAIVGDLGGSMDLESEPGVGSLFRVTLPALVDEAAPAAWGA